MDNPSKLNRTLDFFAVGGMPWIVRVYLFLFLILVIIAALSGSRLPEQEKLFNFSADALKIVLGALLGVLSLAANQTWKASTSHLDDSTGSIQEQEVRKDNS